MCIRDRSSIHPCFVRSHKVFDRFISDLLDCTVGNKNLTRRIQSLQIDFRLRTNKIQDAERFETIRVVGRIRYRTSICVWLVLDEPQIESDRNRDS